MRNVLAIAGKELRVYLTTWTSYILFGAFLELVGFFFYIFVSQYQAIALQYLQQRAGFMLGQMNVIDMILRPMMSNIGIFFLFMLPIVTMRLLAEERRGKTLELLMTTPVRPVEIVLGKYLAGLGIMVVMLGLTIIFPILLSVFGGTAGSHPVDWNTVGVAYAGMFLLGAAFVAVGLFASSVTESQIVAVIVGFGILLLLWVIGAAATGQEGGLRDVFNYMSVMNHLDGFLRGIVRVTDVVYYASVVFIGLFLTYRVVEAQRWR